MCMPLQLALANSRAETELSKIDIRIRAFDPKAALSFRD